MFRPVFLAVIVAGLCSCGGGDAGFRIDNVSLAPDDVPVNTPSTERLSVGADVFDDQHVVLSAWMQAEDGPIWIDLVEGTDGVRWSQSIPLSALHGIPAGLYRFDVHAQDDAGRTVVLHDAVRLRIRLQ